MTKLHFWIEWFMAAAFGLLALAVVVCILSVVAQ
jgi:hypothetical protein